MKISPIWAVLIASAVLLQAVSPAYAENFAQQFPTDRRNELLSMDGELWPTGFRTGGPADDDDSGIEVVDLETFTEAVTTGEADRITGLYVPGFGGFNVVQQSAGNDNSISPAAGVLTQFMRPATGRVIGLLAHNYSSGAWFNSFKKGDLFYVLFGDGRQEIYQLAYIQQYQAVDGNSATSDFVDLSTGTTKSADQVYRLIYTGKPHLTLQTCIQKGDDVNWGRLFLVADLMQ